MSEHTESHGGSNRLYLLVWIALLGLTLVEVVLAYLQVPPRIMLSFLMGLSVLKAALIMAYFMHLRFERLRLTLTLLPALVVCICLLFFVYPDSLRVTELGLR